MRIDNARVKRLVDAGSGGVRRCLSRVTAGKAGLANGEETDHVIGVHRRCLSSCCFAFRVVRTLPRPSLRLYRRPGAMPGAFAQR
jgi:hypothetical protein